MLRRTFFFEEYAWWDARAHAWPRLLAALLCMILGIGIALVPNLLQVLVSVALLMLSANLLVLAIGGFAARRHDRKRGEWRRGDRGSEDEWRAWWLSWP